MANELYRVLIGKWFGYVEHQTHPGYEKSYEESWKNDPNDM